MCSISRDKRRASTAACGTDLALQMQANVKVQVDYQRLNALCRSMAAAQMQADASQAAHERFMNVYSQIFIKKAAAEASINCTEGSGTRRRGRRRRPHTCSGTTAIPAACNPSISTHLRSIHHTSSGSGSGTDRLVREEERVADQLKDIAAIVKKLPVQRTKREVRELADLLGGFPGLFPANTDPSLSIRNELAFRVVGENFSQHGHALPRVGFLYLILKGQVKKIVQTSEKLTFSFSILGPGEHFGTLESSDHLAKSNTQSHSLYPVFVTCEPCTLLTITAAAYQKAIDSYQKRLLDEKHQLIASSPLLGSIGAAIVSRLAEAVAWEVFSRGTVIMSGGDEETSRVGFVQQGSCLVYATVPDTDASSPAQVLLGTLLPGGCVGEPLLRGQSTAVPYTVVAGAGRARVGWVPLSIVQACEVDKHIPAEKPLSIPVLTLDQLHKKHAEKIMKDHWTGLKKHILGEALKEKGISWETKRTK